MMRMQSYEAQCKHLHCTGVNCTNSTTLFKTGITESQFAVYFFEYVCKFYCIALTRANCFSSNEYKNYTYTTRQDKTKGQEGPSLSIRRGGPCQLPLLD